MIKTLEEVCEFINGGAWSADEYAENGAKVIKVSNLVGDGIDESSMNFIPYDRISKYEKNILKAYDVVVTTVGSHQQLKASAAGRAFVIPKDYEGSLLNQNAVCIRPKDENEINKRYLGHLTKSSFFQHFVQSAGRGAANQMRIAISEVKKFRHDFPPFKTQQKIASILSAYDDLIENNLKRIKLLEEVAQNIYKEWFVNFRINGEQLEVNKETGLPQGWEVSQLSACAKYLGRGVTPAYKMGSGFFAINQKANKGSLLDEEQFKEYDPDIKFAIEKFAHFGDLLINSLGEGTIGRVHFYSGEGKKHPVDQHMSIFRSDDFGMSLYLYCYFSSGSGQGHLQSIKKGGTNMTMLNIKDLRGLEVALPPKKHLEEFTGLLLPLFQQKQNLYEQKKRLKIARDLLLPRLMNGTIEV